MGEVKGKLTDETEAAFRKAAMETFGYAKGSISAAIEDAAKEWVAARPKKVETSESLAKFRGVLGHIKKTSVELQHEIWKKRGAMHAHRR